MRPWLAASVLSSLLGSLASGQAPATDPRPFRTHRLFSDHAVLPPATPAPVRGFGPPGQVVVAEASWGAQAETEVDANGRWLLPLPTPAPGGPHTIELRCGEATQRIADVLIGDVWLASGQSNMEWTLANSGDAEREIAAAAHPQLRMFTVTRATAGDARLDVEGEWLVCSPERAAEFSAVAYHFGRELLAARQQPIGLVVSSWGGTVCEAWTSPRALAAFPEFTAALAATRDGARQAESLAERRDAFWRAVDVAAATGESRPVTLPDVWSRQGLADFDGVAVYERRVALPRAWRGAALAMTLGAIDDMDTVWCNEERVGGHEQDGAWATRREYPIPATLTADTDELRLRIRVVDTGGEGGLAGGAADFVLRAADGTVLPLADGWRRTTGASLRDLPRWPRDDGNEPNRPAVLYHAMIAPLAPFPFTGAIWYQGESNRGRAEQYARLFPTMIGDWRQTFARPLPFYFVQIAPFAYEGDRGEAAALRLAQASALQLPRTGMVVTLDVGDRDDIHPRDKRTVGERLALQARHKHHGEAVACDGPFPIAVERHGADLLVRFDGCDGGIVLAEPAAGFEVCGQDGVWHPAQVTSSADTLRLGNPAVALPQQARYAWASTPAATFRNGAKLPAQPFWVRLP